MPCPKRALVEHLTYASQLLQTCLICLLLDHLLTFHLHICVTFHDVRHASVASTTQLLLTLCPRLHKRVFHSPNCELALCAVLTTNVTTRSLYDNIITVQVGAEGKKYFIHQGLICEYSAYFRAALKEGRFAEGRDGLVKLGDDDSQTFGTFMNWLYTSKLPPRPDAVQLKLDSSDPDLAALWSYYDYLLKAWIFGDARGMPKFQDHVMDELVGIFNKRWAPWVSLRRLSFTATLSTAHPCADSLWPLTVTVIAQ